MGTWGFSVMHDDDAADVYGDFIDLFNIDKPRDTVLATVKERYAQDLQDSDTGPVVWLAIAKAMWDCGWLDQPTIDRVEEIVARGEGLDRWEEQGPRALEKRRSAMQQFLKQLRTPNPSPRKPKRPIQRKPVFQTGDCLSYRLDDGRYAAGIVLGQEDPDPRREVETYGKNLLGILDWIGADKPTPEVFESRRWLRLTHHKWDGCQLLQYAFSRDFRDYQSRIEVAGRTDLRPDDPQDADSLGGWVVFEQVVLQERWDKGERA